MPEFDPTIHCYLRQPSRKGMAGLKSLAGQRFHRLFVYGFLGMTKGKQSMWLCRCDCGKWFATQGGNLKTGNSQSCGCWNLDKTPYSKTHGMTGTLVYRIWSGVYTRIYNFKHRSSRRYGRRGLTLCQGLRKFEDFYAITGEPPSKVHSIDRWPNNKDGGYWCGQCEECLSKGWPKNWRWADPLEQGGNMRSNVTLTHNGETHHLSEWARIRKMNVSTISYRVRKGWPAEEVLDFQRHIREY